MIVPILLILLSLLFVLMWVWIFVVFIENTKLKKEIDELVNQPITMEQKAELDNLQLDLDTNAYRARKTKRVVLFFAFLFVAAAIGLVWANTRFSLYTYDGLLENLKLTMMIIILFFTPAYIGLELISNTQGASGDISRRLRLNEELKPGEEVEV
ncbi:MAG: hypothetical protein ACLFP1_05045 [Candidatus Goldiibacteriota bacterium]